MREYILVEPGNQLEHLERQREARLLQLDGDGDLSRAGVHRKVRDLSTKKTKRPVNSHSRLYNDLTQERSVLSSREQRRQLDLQILSLLRNKGQHSEAIFPSGKKRRRLSGTSHQAAPHLRYGFGGQYSKASGGVLRGVELPPSEVELVR